MKERSSELSRSGYEPVAVISKEPEELAVGRRLVFEERYDDLDSLRESTFLGPSRATFGLVRPVHAPRSGTQLLVRARSLSQATDLLAEAVDTLDLTMADLIWIRRELWAGMSAATEKRAAERKAAGKASEDGARAGGRAGRATREEVSSAPKKAVAALHPDSALAKVVGSGPMPRNEITKKLWAYIKRKGLQDKQNRRMINADDALRPVVGGKSQVNMLELPKLVDKHLKSKR